MVQGASFLSKKRGNLELPKSSKANGCGKCSSHYPQSSRKECQTKQIPLGSQGSLQSPNPRRFIKAPLNTLPVFQSNPRYPRRGNINGDAPCMPKRQERAMDNRKSSGARKKAKLNQPCNRPENVKIFLPV